MGFVKIWVHLVWTTKNREPFLTSDIRRQVFTHIRMNAVKKGIHVDFINGYLDHVHCLISMGPGQNIETVMRLLKGESSYWMNKNKTLNRRFAWQREYYAVSVSESVLNRVRDYIRNQENHHRKTSFNEEYQEFIRKFRFDAALSD
jgi:putative transposase